MGLSPSPPSMPFARASRQQQSNRGSSTDQNSVHAYSDIAPSLGSADHILPDESNFRSSLILPHLERRFSLMNSITPDAVRSQLRAQRARAQEKQRPFLTEEEEEEIIAQLQVRIEANAKARGEELPAAKGKLGILLPPINDHPWDSVLERGTDGFGGHIPIYAAAPSSSATSAIGNTRNSSPSIDPRSLPSLTTTTASSPPQQHLSPPGSSETRQIDSPPSPSRREKDDATVGSLFSSRGARAEAAYIRSVAKQRSASAKASDPPTAAVNTAPPHSSATSAQLAALSVSAAPGKPPVEPLPQPKDRESILSSSRSSTSSNRPSMNMLLTPVQPQITIETDNDDVGSQSQHRSGSDSTSFRSQLKRQTPSRLLTTLSPEAFKRVSTALDELFDHFRAEAGVSPVNSESETHHGPYEGVLDQSTEPSALQRTSQEIRSTAPLAIRSSTTQAGLPTTDEGINEVKRAGSYGMNGHKYGSDADATETAPAPVPSGLHQNSNGSTPAPSIGNVHTGAPHRTSVPASPRSGMSERSGISSGPASGQDSQPLHNPLNHTRTFSIDSFGSTTSSMARYGLTPPTLPAKRTSSLPKRRHKSTKDRDTEAKSSAPPTTATPPISEAPTVLSDRKGKQREEAEDTGAQPVSAPPTLTPQAAQATGETSPNNAAMGLGALPSAIGSGAAAIGAAMVGALSSVTGGAAAENADADADDAHTVKSADGADGGSETPATTRAPTAIDTSRVSKANVASPSPTSVRSPVPPNANQMRPGLEHMRGASTFSQMSFVSADSFRSAEDGGSLASAVDGAPQGTGLGLAYQGLDSLSVEQGTPRLVAENVHTGSAASHALGLDIRALSAAGSVGGTSGRGSFVDDDLEEEDAFGYDRRGTLRPSPRTPGSPFEQSDAFAAQPSAYLSETPQPGRPGDLSPIPASIGTETRRASPEPSPDTAMRPSPTFGAQTSPGDATVPAAPGLASPFPDTAATLAPAELRPPSAISAITSVPSDRTSQQSSLNRPSPVTVASIASNSASSHQRDASTSSVHSFTGEANLIGAANIGNRRRSSTLSSRVLPPTSSANTSPSVAVQSPATVGPATGASLNSGVTRGRSGSVDGARSVDSHRRGSSGQLINNATQRPDYGASQPLSLTGPTGAYGMVHMRQAGRPGHVPTSSASSYTHQRYGSATGTQLSFDPANGRIRVGPNVPNAHTFGPGPPPMVMTHSASGTVGTPLIDASPPSAPNSAGRLYQNSSTSAVPFEGPMPMMQMSPQPGTSMSAAQSQNVAANAGSHRRRLSNKGSNSSINRNLPPSAFSNVVQALRPSSSSSSNGVPGSKTPASSTGAGLSSGFLPSTNGSMASTDLRSPLGHGTPMTLSREPSDASHASGWVGPPSQMKLAGPHSAAYHQTPSGSLGLAKRPSDSSLTGSLAAQNNISPVSPAGISHHSSNASITGSIRGTPVSTNVLTASAIAARNAHRNRGRSNSGSSGVPKGSPSVTSPAGLGLAGFFTPSPPGTPASAGIQQMMALQAQQNVAASGGFRAVASAAQAATADSISMPGSEEVSQRRAPPGPVNPPGFSFPARSPLAEHVTNASDSRSTSRTAAFQPDDATDASRSDLLRVQGYEGSKATERASIRSVSDINASSDEEDAPAAVGRMSTGEDVWATVARNTTQKRVQGSGKSNAPGSRAASVKSPEPGVIRKRSQDLLKATSGTTTIPLHTDSSVLTAEQLAEIQSALARSESQRSISRAGAASSLGHTPPVPSLPSAVARGEAIQSSAGSRVLSPGPASISTPFFSPREEMSQSSAMQTFGTEPRWEGQSRQQTQNSAQFQNSESPQGLPIQRNGSTQTRADLPTHIAARTPVLASTFKSEVMYDVTSSHRPTSPTISHKSKRSDLPSLFDLSAQASGYRPISPIMDLDEHALSLSQAIDEATARQQEFTFPAMHDRGHQRGNSSIDSRLAGRSGLGAAFVQQGPNQQQAIREESSEIERSHDTFPGRPAQPRRSKSHDQLTGATDSLLPSTPLQAQTATSDIHLNVGTRLVDDVAAQTRAATRALKGPEENAAMAIPKRSRTLSKRKSQKKLNKIISQPLLLNTSQRMDHAVDIKTPDAMLNRSAVHRSGGSSYFAGDRHSGSTRGHSKASVNGKTLHRRHSSSFGHSGDIKEGSPQDANNVGDVSFPMQSPTTPGGTHFGTKLLDRFRSRKRTEQAIFGKFSSPNTASKSAAALTRSPASSFGHATLGPEPMSMASHGMDHSVDHSQPGQAEYYQQPQQNADGLNQQPLSRNMAPADRDNRLKLVSALSFGSPLDQTIGETIGVQLATTPEERRVTETQASSPFLHGQSPQFTIQPPTADEAFSKLVPAAFAPSETARNTEFAKSARDTIVRRTIIIPTESAFDKRKVSIYIDLARFQVLTADDLEQSTISSAAKRKSRQERTQDDKEVLDSSYPASPSLPPEYNTAGVVPSLSTELRRRSIQDRPPTPPGPAGVGNLHRRKVSADMLAEQPLPPVPQSSAIPISASPSNDGLKTQPTLKLPALTSQDFASKPGKLGLPLPSPATASVASLGNGSLYDYYMNDDNIEEDEHDDQIGGLPMQPSASMENSVRNHIEVTERADGSVIWQVIAGLAERSSVYSDDARLSYLSNGSRNRESVYARGGRVDSLYVPDGNSQTVSGLTPDDSRSFFAPKYTGHRKSFSFENHPMPSLPSMSNTLSAADTTAPLSVGGDARHSIQTAQRAQSPQFTSPIGFDMATSSGPSTRIVYTNDSDLAHLLESFAQGKDSAKFDFVKDDQGIAAQPGGADADQSRQRVEAEIYTLLNSQSP
ncbi:hypothetical protein OC845_004899 [Tilletia horrida]|nr:hypothetical protein OC845_004899 [Tilletia horrida]